MYYFHLLPVDFPFLFCLLFCFFYSLPSDINLPSFISSPPCCLPTVSFAPSPNHLHPLFLHTPLPPTHLLFLPLPSSQLPSAVFFPLVIPLSSPLLPLPLQSTATATTTPPAPPAARTRSRSSLRSPSPARRVFASPRAARRRRGKCPSADVRNSADCRTRRRAARSRQTAEVRLSNTRVGRRYSLSSTSSSLDFILK